MKNIKERLGKWSKEKLVDKIIAQAKALEHKEQAYNKLKNEKTWK